MIKTIFIAAMLAAATTLSLIATPLVYAQDTSETSTDQDIKQKNTGSDESTNFNCGQNLYKAGVGEQECEQEEEGRIASDVATDTDVGAATDTEDAAAATETATDTD